ncbi:MAG: 3-hydroxyacyl-CoA dehydrogenase/enoyl-CoA hydratase family protein [Saprospiraceae bacterium]|nr:3-hydroxyacyl-CoA dehydrogenase/enoyl-CoA hydratase family protein [Saprospiraceae bacterium]MCF8249272.1 3-hydroxyacyl-CoA dehydrogenase/enoyl-CoA hydratase family protein [Saprospiraceae bacterium]MCF8281160.1 3-hydroxyacyl-CoA dehydrogenase/enoyl-CoA hydratase family protein [Bacteroidales bacterium]MCF8311451.1 3-hydroxyacyl-CoA dehydrogenase/enoyl-CoA hydratase family protein [Saprospiraceae bacterium]MCF8439891.1 3-hydroxyacyl-CoA dehydrogenase/enoyl-CoA hydratase family protein [Sapro
MRRITKVAVLGSGVMGSGIACHLANVGLQVLLLDILPPNIADLKPTDQASRNSIANAALAAAIKSKPAPLYDNAFASRITTGNFEDDFQKIKDYDWVIEVVVERLDIKQQIFEKVDQFRKKGTLVTSNTSGIPIHMMLEGRSEDFQEHFCGTHFFNPPRYMRLLEIIPTKATRQDVVDFFLEYGDVYLGKQTVLAKDTPAFIANRVGVYAMAKIYQLTTEIGLSITEVDALTGPAIGRPNTGTFRLGDLVGHDTAAKVIQGIKDNCPNDEQAGAFEIPKYLNFLLENKFLGNKTGQGFYKKTGEKDEKGKPVILALNLDTLEYGLNPKPSLPSIGVAKQIDDLPKRVKAVFSAEDQGGELVRRSLLGLFAYVSNRIPEIANDLYSIDDALRAGFAWDLGPFEYWDAIGVQEGIELAEKQGEKVASWVKEMLAAGNERFYKREAGKLFYYNIKSKAYKEVPGTESFVILENYRDKKPVFQNPDATLHDIGDGVLCLEYQSKANTMGEGVLRGINDAIKIAEEGDWKGLVLGNNAKNFSVGANLMMVAMMAYEQEWDQLGFAVKMFQNTVMRCRYSSIPVVAATQGYVFGGACETIMHCDAAVCAAESYIGLVEVGVGLLPGGAGTKELALRASDAFFEGDVQIPTLIEKFKTIALASVATSAPQAFNLGYLQHKKDSVAVNAMRNIADAKQKVLELANNYVQPIERQDVTVLGRGGLGALYVAANELKLGNYASEHDIKIAKKIAFVLCGGDLTGEQKVSERYLLDLEREAFLSLCGEQKTLERIQYMLTNNKPLRN